jgi:hypothetical protein
MDPVVALRGSVRASDADRARVVAALRRHFAVGRLDTDELEQRVAVAYEARWRAELRSLLRDMPFEPPIDRTRVVRGVDRAQRTLLRPHLICWAVFNTVMLAVWAWSGGHGAWPIVAILPTTLLLAWHTRGSRSLSRRLESAADGRRAALPRRRALV